MNDPQPTVGFIGVGSIGRPLLDRILAQGREVHVYDVNAAALADLPGNAVVAASPREVADRAEVALSCLPTVASNEAVVRAEDGVLGGAALRTYVLTGTTGAPTVAALADDLAAAGVTLVDCPITGGVPRARTGELTAILSGDPGVRAEVDAVVGAFASKVAWVGERPGDAQRVKLINNLLSASNLALACEALVLAEKIGLDLPMVLDVVNSGSGQNYATSSKIPDFVVPRLFKRGGNLGGLLKDLEQAGAEAERWGVPMPLHDEVRTAFARAIAAGDAADDSTTVIWHMEAAAGLDPDPRDPR